MKSFSGMRWQWLRSLLGGGRAPVASRSHCRLSLESLERRDVPATLTVTTGADAGVGSLRAAIVQANGDASIDKIVIKSNVQSIQLTSALVYTGAQDLTVEGHGAVIQPAFGSEGTFDLFVSSGGADLSLDKIGFRDGANGIIVSVPVTATGTVVVTLEKVTVTNNRLFGVHIDDQTLGSAASIELNVDHSSFTGNGTGDLDQDGIRVDEGGLGNIVAHIEHTIINGNGGDGLELDERGDGSVFLSLDHTEANANGFFNVADLDDGVDIDEAGAGNIVVEVEHATFNGNFEEGLDLNESDAGDMIVKLEHVEAIGNGEEGIDVEEDKDTPAASGDVWVEMAHVVANNNGKEGFDLKEQGLGSNTVSLEHIIASGNAGDGIKVDEKGDGDVTATLKNIVANDNTDEGVDLDEANAGVLSASLKNIVSNDPLDVA